MNLTFKKSEILFQVRVFSWNSELCEETEVVNTTVYSWEEAMYLVNQNAKPNDIAYIRNLNTGKVHKVKKVQ